MAEQGLSYSASLCEVADMAASLSLTRACARGTANFANFRAQDCWGQSEHESRGSAA